MDKNCDGFRAKSKPYSKAKGVEWDTETAYHAWYLKSDVTIMAEHIGDSIWENEDR